MWRIWVQPSCDICSSCDVWLSFLDLVDSWILSSRCRQLAFLCISLSLSASNCGGNGCRWRQSLWNTHILHRFLTATDSPRLFLLPNDIWYGYWIKNKVYLPLFSGNTEMKCNWDQSSSAQTAETAAADILIYLYSCAYDHTTHSTTGRWMLRAGEIRGHSQMPSPHSSFSGSCCSLHLATQYRAQPQLVAVRDGTILACVGVEEGGMVTGWVGSLCSVCWRPAGVSVPQTRVTTGGVLSGVTRLQRSTKIRNLNCPSIYNV